MAVAYPGGAVSNTFVPTFEASNSLIIGYSRNPKKFKLAQYSKYVPVKKIAGYYLYLTALEAGRIINTGLNDFVWADNQEAPMGNNNLESFQFVYFNTTRYVFPFSVGDIAVEMADWELIAWMGGVAAQKAITARTQYAWNILGTSGNFGTSTSTATALAGGQLDAGTQTSPFLKIAIGAACEQILQQTLGVLGSDRSALVMVMNPHTARLISQSSELMAYFVNNKFALAQARGDEPGQNAEWGLPDQIYGIKVVVEDAAKVTSKKGATTPTFAYVCPAQMVLIMARPGGIDGMEGIPEFSSAQFHFREEFTTETKNDPDNRRTIGRVVENYWFGLTDTRSTYLITAATAS
jgi:hypothetical protein